MHISITSLHWDNNRNTDKAKTATEECSQSIEIECHLEKSLRPPQTEIVRAGGAGGRILRKPYVCRCNEEGFGGSG